VDKDAHVETAPRRPTAFEAIDAARHFADLLREVEYVERIILEDADWEGLRLWTVLASPAFEDRYGEPVYEAQGQVIDELGEPVFDFRVINVNELKGRLEDVLPANGRVLYERHART
jgi:hypothetical protein